MSRRAKLRTTFAVALLLAGLVWLTQARNSETPTASAPRGQFASDRAAEEPTAPVSSKP